MNVIDHNNPTPLHMQAESYLRGLIEKPEYQNGKLLPNEVELSKQLNISRNTLRQAINKLVFEGLLLRKKGIGTTVAKKSISGRAKNWMSFSEEMNKLGIKIHNFELHVSRKKPTAVVSHFFGLEGDSPKCLVLERVRGKKEYPFVYFISYFNPAIAISEDEYFLRPLYDILENDYNVKVKLSIEEISASLAGDAIAEKLNISPQDPILIRKRFVYDENSNPVEYNIGYYRADSFTYTIEAER